MLETIRKGAMKKKCSLCKQIKALSRFSPLPSAALKVHSQCKSCRSKRNAKQAARWNRENIESHRASSRKHNIKRRPIVLALRKEKYRYMRQFSCINSLTASKASSWSWNRIHEFLDKETRERI